MAKLIQLCKIKKKKKSENCSVMSDFVSPWNSPGQNTGVGSLSLLQGIFPNQRSNPGLPHCRRILYQLNHKGSLSGVGSLSLLQGIFPTQEWNQGLLHCRQILYQLSYQEVLLKTKGLPWGSEDKESTCNAGSSRELERSPRGGHGNPL